MAKVEGSALPTNGSRKDAKEAKTRRWEGGGWKVRQRAPRVVRSEALRTLRTQQRAVVIGH